MLKRYAYFLPTLGQSWILLLIFVLGALLSSGLALITSSFIPFAKDYLEPIYYVISYLPVLIYVRKYSDMIRSEEGNAPVKIDNPFFGKIGPATLFIILFFLTFCVNILSDPIMSLMDIPSFYNDMIAEMLEKNILLSLLTTAIFAPFFEELLCRGIILRGLLTKMEPWKAIVWSSTLFAIMHMNLYQGVSAFIFGLFLGWVYYKTRSLWAAIFIHAINNGSSLIMLHLFPDLAELDSTKEILPPALYYTTLLIALVVTVAAYLYINKNIVSKKDEDKKTIPL